MTRLIVPMTSPEFDDALDDLRRAAHFGADAVEIRLDHMNDLSEEQFRALRAADGVPATWLLTPRSRDEGGVWDADDMNRVSRLIELAPYASLCDVELATWERSANIRQKVRLAVSRLDGDAGPRLVLSAHDFRGRPADLLRRVERMCELTDCDVVKVVFFARHISESFELFDLMRQAPKPIIALAMGEAGLITRLLARKFGAFGTFASLATGKESAPGQVTIAEMKSLYRWDAQGPDTAVYGVIGHPIAHSMSPAIHNAAFETCGVDAVYVPLLIEPTYEHFVDFLRHALERPWFGLRGCSVTIPHKENALRFARQRGARIEPLAERIGAVNTLAFRDDGLDARNTDYAGALDALTQTIGCERHDLRGVPVAVLGAGGAARAIVAGLCDCGADVTIYNRTAERATKLAAEFGCTARPNDERVRPDTRIVVNATSIGMHPRVDDSPLPAERLRPDMTVFDTVYNPIETRLLREAGEIGCRTVDGVAMFVNQAAAQFELWTARPAPRDVMRRVVLERLER